MDFIHTVDAPSLISRVFLDLDLDDYVDLGHVLA